MGIRFYCPKGHKLNVKAFLAGKAGLCPRCGATVQIPLESTRLPTGKATVSARVWYVRSPGGDQFGPITADVVESWVAENRIGPDSLVWCEGWPEWQRAASVFQQLEPLLPEMRPVAVRSSARRAGRPAALALRRKSPYRVLGALVLIVVLLAGALAWAAWQASGH